MGLRNATTSSVTVIKDEDENNQENEVVEKADDRSVEEKETNLVVGRPRLQISRVGGNTLTSCVTGIHYASELYSERRVEASWVQFSQTF